MRFVIFSFLNVSLEFCFSFYVKPSASFVSMHMSFSSRRVAGVKITRTEYSFIQKLSEVTLPLYFNYLHIFNCLDKQFLINK